MSHSACEKTRCAPIDIGSRTCWRSSKPAPDVERGVEKNKAAVHAARIAERT